MNERQLQMSELISQAGSVLRKLNSVAQNAQSTVQTPQQTLPQHSVTVLNYVSVAVFLIVLGFLIYLIKAYFAKFIAFYLIRRDYERIKPLNKTTVNVQSKSETTTGDKRITFTQWVGLYNVQIIQEMISYHPLIGAFGNKWKGLRALKMPTMIVISFGLLTLLITLSISLALQKLGHSVCFEKRFAANNYYLCQSRNSTEDSNQVNLIGIAIIASFISIIISLVGTYFLSKNYLKFLKSIQMNSSLSKDDIQSEKMPTDQKNMNLQTSQHQPTLQNMLGDDSEFTRRSLKPAIALNNHSKQNLFQINEDEEEEPFSPGKNITNQSRHSRKPEVKVLGENQNVLNISNSQPYLNNSKNVIAHGYLDYESGAENKINDPPQFCSYNKDNNLIFDDESVITNHYELEHQKAYSNAYSQRNLFKKGTHLQMPGHKSQSQMNPNHSSKQLLHSMAGMSDSTTIIDGQGNLNSNQQIRQLEGIQEENEIRKSANLFQERLQDAGFFNNHKDNLSTPGRRENSQASKEESKDEDSSRILMMKHFSKKQGLSDTYQLNLRKSVNQRQSKFNTTYGSRSQIVLLFVVLATIMSLAICALYILYSFYNMTNQGLISTLITFAIAVGLDFIILRPLSIAMIAIFSTIRVARSESITDKTSCFEEEEVNLLGNLYEDYELQLEDVNYNTTPNSHESNQILMPALSYDEEKSAQNNSKSPIRNQRILYNVNKQRKLGNKSEIVLVESTVWYHQPQMILNQNLSNQSNSQQVSDSNQNFERKDSKKKPMRQGEKVEYVKSISFNAEDLKLHKSNTERLHLHFDNDHYDIEEIPMNSSGNHNNNNNTTYLEHQPQFNPMQESERLVTGAAADRSSIMHPIATMHQQFETPKGVSQSKNDLGQGRISHQILQPITQPGDVRESQQEQKLLLKDLLLHSSSSLKKKSTHQQQEINLQEYQSLKRYLDEDKENNSSIKHKSKKGSILKLRESIKSSSNRKMIYVENNNFVGSPAYEDKFMALNPVQCQDEEINFTPQYSSQQKSQIQPKTGNYQFKQIENRKSMALPQIFSDLKNVSICSDLQKPKLYHNKKSNANSAAKPNKSKKIVQHGKENVRFSIDPNNKTQDNDEDAIVFSDLKNHPITTAQKLASRKSFNSPGSIKENLEARLNKHNLQVSNKQAMASIMQQPNVSPFNEHKYHNNNNTISQSITNEEEQNTMAGPVTMNIDSPHQRDDNSPKISNFKHMKQDEQHVRSSGGSNNMNLKNLLQPQLNFNKNQSKKMVQNLIVQEQPALEDVNTIQSKVNDSSLMGTKTIENTIDVHAKNILKGKKGSKPQIKPKNKTAKQSKENIQVSSAIVNTSEFESDHSKTISKALMMLNNQADEEIILDRVEIGNNSRLNETSRSKMFEDSDTSTFRMINFSKQRSKKQLIDLQSKDSLANTVTTPIDFYSNSTQPINMGDLQANTQNETFEYHTKTQEFKRSKKQSIAEIIYEENEFKNSLSPEKPEMHESPQIIIAAQESVIDETDESQVEEENEKDCNDLQSENEGSNNGADEEEENPNGEFNIMERMMKMNEGTGVFNMFLEHQYSNDNLEMKICKRQPSIASKQLVKGKKRNNQARSMTRTKVSTTSQNLSNAFELESQRPDYDKLNSNLKLLEEMKRKKEEDELLQFRLQDQKRKLKHFLKLARQLKSIKDEKKIKELLKILKQTQKPLPMQLINQLKSLEIMSSPYNQSLIDIIKDEFEKNQKTQKPPMNNKKQNSKSQLRNQAKQGEVIQKLSGIYGQQVGVNALASGRGVKSRESSFDTFAKPQTASSKNKILQRASGSRDSSMNSQRGQRSKQGRNKSNQIHVIDQSLSGNTSSYNNQSSSMINDKFRPPRQQHRQSNNLTKTRYESSDQSDQDYDQHKFKSIKGNFITNNNDAQAIEIDDDFNYNDNESQQDQFNHLQNFMQQQQPNTLGRE